MFSKENLNQINLLKNILINKNKRASKNFKKYLLTSASKKLILFLVSLAFNLLNNNISLSCVKKRQLKAHKRFLERLGSPEGSLKEKYRLLQLTSNEKLRKITQLMLKCVQYG